MVDRKLAKPLWLRCEDAGAMQGRKHAAAGGTRRTDGGKNQRIEDHVGVAVVSTVSPNKKLGAAAGNSSVINFRRSSRG